MSDDETLRCSTCGLPYARIENGVLVIESRHHGETHTNVIAISELVRRIRGDRTWPPATERKQHH